jgi:hypothetical protein
MSDPVPVSFNNTWKAVITLLTLGFNVGIIVFCLWKGDPANSLHSSGMAWAFMMSAGILIGLGIGSITPDLKEAFKR